jgi:hypothetical protein
MGLPLRVLSQPSSVKADVPSRIVARFLIAAKILHQADYNSHAFKLKHSVRELFRTHVPRGLNQPDMFPVTGSRDLHHSHMQRAAVFFQPN